ncbi:ABC transporter permease [Pseudonocardia humida]|uniref:ABC transporter permease n=1 Tax=Pseudonocardia humida TaxID=2800819 RepID=A0ABT1A065_9PSEU|nr:ABC transporter permease [Pseudonocardia humida]MCO1656398.1 ABC transporter permease [Pseudonocardia humida]
MSTPASTAKRSGSAAVAAGPTAAERLTSLMPVLALAVLVVALAAADPDFLRRSSLMAVVDAAAPLAVLAAGATLVVLCGGIDLSIAALASLSSVLLALWLPGLDALAWPAVVAVAAVAGALQGAAHVFLRIPSFIVTLGGMSVFSSIALVVSGAATVPVVDDTSIRWGFSRVLGTVPSAAVVAVVVVAVLALIVKVTPLDSSIKATGYSEAAARLAGIPVDLVKIGAFCVSGACAGLAAVLLVARTFSGGPTLADSLLLPAVAAIVIGGTAITGGHGGVWRTVVGALVVTLLRVGLSIVGVSAAYESILYGAIIVVAVALTLDRSKVLVVK